MLAPDARGFFWVLHTYGPDVYTVKCKARGTHATWNVCRVEFNRNAPTETKEQTMDTLLDVCRMRYADEVINQGERK